ncbi:MAG: DUF3450 family protein [Pseudomonadota bacterium]
MGHRFVRALVMCTSLVSFQSFGEIPKIDALSQSLIKVRGEVEQLDAQVSTLRENGKLEIQTLKVQQGELAASIEAEKLRSDQLKGQISELKGQLSDRGFEDQQMKSLVLNAISEFQLYVQSSIPFQADKRSKELSQLAEKVEKDQMTSVKAAIRLWSFVEDELRSATENSVFRQTIVVEGNEKLVEVAKLGSVFLFYKTTDGQYGTLKREDDQWLFQRLVSSSDEAKVALLFESLKKQIRTGQFSLPNQLKGRL